MGQFIAGSVVGLITMFLLMVNTGAVHQGGVERACAEKGYYHLSSTKRLKCSVEEKQYATPPTPSPSVR